MIDGTTERCWWTAPFVVWWSNPVYEGNAPSSLLTRTVLGRGTSLLLLVGPGCVFTFVGCRTKRSVPSIFLFSFGRHPASSFPFSGCFSPPSFFSPRSSVQVTVITVSPHREPVEQNSVAKRKRSDFKTHHPSPTVHNLTGRSRRCESATVGMSESSFRNCCACLVSWGLVQCPES